MFLGLLKRVQLHALLNIVVVPHFVLIYINKIIQANVSTCILSKIIPELNVKVKKVNLSWKQTLFPSDLQSQWLYNDFEAETAFFALQVVSIVGSVSGSTKCSHFWGRFWNLFSGKDYSTDQKGTDPIVFLYKNQG